MSLKRNIAASYAGQLYVTLISIALVPMYVKYMGAETYGLVGFYATLQAWFMLLDLGLTPTMAREAARYGGGAIDALTFRRLLRTLEGIFVGVAILGAAAMIAASHFIASHWLKVQELPTAEVQGAIKLMALVIALRWVCGLYRGTLTGFEQIIWLNGFNAAIATGRFAAIIPFLMYVARTPTAFFEYQLVVAAVELSILVAKVYRLAPQVHASADMAWDWAPLRHVLKFSLTIAFTSAAWVFLTQSDKLLLSGLIPLADYAYFTLAVLVASGITVISGPVSTTLLPRMTRLNASGDEQVLIDLYRTVSQLVAVLAISASLVCVFFGRQVLWAWTGNTTVAQKAAPVLALYACGNGILALAAFPYYLQYAKGDLRLHLIGNVLFIAMFLPLLYVLTRTYGAMGAGYAWIVSNLLPFAFWVPVVHRRFVAGLHARWLLQDLLPIATTSAIAAYLLKSFVVWPADRLSVAATVTAIGLILCAVAGLSSRTLRETLCLKWRTRLAG